MFDQGNNNIKYEIWKFVIQFSKNIIKKEVENRSLQKKLKYLHENLTGFQSNQCYLECKLRKIYAKKTNIHDIQAGSKGKWYEDRKKSIS